MARVAPAEVGPLRGDADRDTRRPQQDRARRTDPSADELCESRTRELSLGMKPTPVPPEPLAVTGGLRPRWVRLEADGHRRQPLRDREAIQIGQLDVEQHNLRSEPLGSAMAPSPSAASPTTANPSASSSADADSRNASWSSTMRTVGRMRRSWQRPSASASGLAAVPAAGFRASTDRRLWIAPFRWAVAPNASAEIPKRIERVGDEGSILVMAVTGLAVLGGVAGCGDRKLRPRSPPETV